MRSITVMADGRPNDPPKRQDDAAKKEGHTARKVVFDKTMSATANLARLLPSGTTLTFETLAPSFTNHGNCYPVNRVLTSALIGFLSLLCLFLAFTDSITDEDGNIYYGLALFTRKGFYAFNYHDDDDGQRTVEEKERKKMDFDDKCKEKKARLRDLVHAVLSAVVFFSLAFDDTEVQICLLQSRLSVQWKEFFVNMPLAAGFLASLVFTIFPSTRSGIGNGVGAATNQPPSKGGHDMGAPPASH